VEAHSEHHLAGAVLRHAQAGHPPAGGGSPSGFAALAGRGVAAFIDGEEYFVGSHLLIEQRGVCSPKAEEVITRLEREGNTVLLVAKTEKLLGAIAVTDQVREHAREAVAALQAHRIRSIVMLTGDNPEVAEAIARQAGIAEVHAGVLPEAKAEYIRNLNERYGSVMMVGDGINDAPAMAAATVGVAMGGSGTDLAMETADVVLMSDDLRKISYAVRLSRRVRAIIRQNILLALGIKLCFILLGTLGIASLWLAVGADDGVTLLVVLNGMRALRTVSTER